MNNLSIKQALAAGWSSFVNNWLVWFGAATVFMVLSLPDIIYRASLGIADESAPLPFGVGAILVGLIMAIGFLVVTAGNTKLNIQGAQGEKLSLSTLFKYWYLGLKLLGFFILYAIMVIAGTIAFIIPGIYLAIRYSQTPYVIVDQPNMGITSAMAESTKLTKGKILSLLLAAIVIGLVVAIPLMLLMVLITAIANGGDTSTVTGMIASNILSIIPGAVVTAVAGVAYGSIYLQLRSSSSSSQSVVPQASPEAPAAV